MESGISVLVQYPPPPAIPHTKFSCEKFANCYPPAAAYDGGEGKKTYTYIIELLKQKLFAKNYLVMGYHRIIVIFAKRVYEKFLKHC